ncbi:MAG: hypothetical protein JRC92_06645 [Deltaproteobacteria bacterium]|nr:hypothetical protein [Deltaproteobacteria bacterium]
MGRFFSDSHRPAKLIGLVLIYLGLAFYYRAAAPLTPTHWKWVLGPQAAPQASLEESFAWQVEVHLAKVLRVLPAGEGVLIGLGPERVEARALGRIEARPGQMIDLVGLYMGGVDICVDEFRLHRFPRWIKLAVSLAAAVFALALFFWVFRLEWDQKALFRPRDD